VRITRVEPHHVSLGRYNAVYVEVETDTDMVGVGETVLKRRDRTVVENVREMAEYLIGRDPLTIEDHFEKLYRDSFWVGGPLHAAGRSAIDIALWDLKGQYYQAPIYDLLGGRSRTHIPVYCHCPSGASPEDFAANLRDCRGRGYRAAKTTLPVFYGQAGETNGVGYSGGGGRIDPSLKETEYLPTRVIDEVAEYFAAGRAAVGDDFELLLDCHGRLNPANAIRLAEALAPYRLLFIEEPIPPESAVDLAHVTGRSTTPIAAGERLTSVYEVRPYLELRSLAVLQCDIVNCGGFTGAKKIANLAEAYYVPLAPHNPNGPIATLATAHLLTAIPNALILETVGAPSDLARAAEIVDEPLVAVDGQVEVPARPGLGARLREGVASRFPAEPVGGYR
jgi:galactonate dehydratase